MEGGDRIRDVQLGNSAAVWIAWLPVAVAITSSSTPFARRLRSRCPN